MAHHGAPSAVPPVIQLRYLSPPVMSAATYSSYSRRATSTIACPLPPAIVVDTPSMTGTATDMSMGTQSANMRIALTMRMNRLLPTTGPEERKLPVRDHGVHPGLVSGSRAYDEARTLSTHETLFHLGREALCLDH